MIDEENNIFLSNSAIKLKEIIRKKNPSQIFVLTDSNCKDLCLPTFRQRYEIENFTIIELPAGEDNKTLESLEKIWKEMLHADRSALLINLGGGVITDMGGMAAALFKRGIGFINIPTSLLAMVDASVGGKTGVNFNHLKNHIGLFVNPLATIIDTVFLDSLPQKQFKSGIAEILKIGFILNNDLFLKAKDINPSQKIDNEIVKLAIETKLRIVNQDFKESGKRKLLNFGHTVGHALESFSITKHSEPLLHGEAVALGMIAESFIAAKMGMLAEENFSLLRNSVLKFFPTNLWVEFPEEPIMDLMLRDKKNNLNSINFSLPTDVGIGLTDIFPDDAIIYESIEYINTL